MIVKIGRSGKSFKGLAQYLTHDPNAETSERVAWTHTLNLAHDHVPSAVDEMYRTYLDAEILKEEAGVKRGGRVLEAPVKHASLNWHPDDAPTKKHMIETTQALLQHMGWHEHQAVLVAHQDKKYSHVHVELNAIHPETGLKLDDGLEKRRAQEWGAQYERSQDQIRCEQRLKLHAEREDAPTGPAWEAMKEAERQHAAAEQELRNRGDAREEKTSGDDDVWKFFGTRRGRSAPQSMVGGKPCAGSGLSRDRGRRTRLDPLKNPRPEFLGGRQPDAPAALESGPPAGRLVGIVSPKRRSCSCSPGGLRWSAVVTRQASERPRSLRYLWSQARLDACYKKRRGQEMMQRPSDWASPSRMPTSLKPNQRHSRKRCTRLRFRVIRCGLRSWRPCLETSRRPSAEPS